MDGLLVIDKPAGLTSHDVVARMRRVLKERSIGHTGTLDPMATGVLALVVGRATRLAKFMSASDKCYEAVVALGVRTDTADAEGEPIGARYQGPLPGREAIDAALDAFRGTFLQRPPAFSAKKIGGVRSYKLARAARQSQGPGTGPGSGSDPEPGSGSDPGSDPGSGSEPGTEPGTHLYYPAAVSVTTSAIEILSVEQGQVTLRVVCSAGFYVRSLADDLGQRLGTGAHLSALRRTRSGDFDLAGSMTLDAAQQDPDEAAAFLIPMGQLLTGFPAGILTAEGVLRATHGRDLSPADFDERPQGSNRFCRLLDRDGGLVGIAEPAGGSGFLHPSIVLV